MYTLKNVFLVVENVKETGHFFETLSIGSVPGTDHSQIYAFLMNNNCFSGQKLHLYECASAVFFSQRRLVYAGTAIEVMVFGCNTKKKNYAGKDIQMHIWA